MSNNISVHGTRLIAGTFCGQCEADLYYKGNRKPKSYPYIYPDDPITHPEDHKYNCECDGCECQCTRGEYGKINREAIPRLVSMKVKPVVYLDVQLYFEDEKEDKIVSLKLGNTYTFTCLSEYGVCTHTGKLLGFYQYSGLTENEFNNISLCAYSSNDMIYLKIDCSENHESKILKVGLQSIRDIEEYVEEDSTTSEDNTNTEITE